MSMPAPDATAGTPEVAADVATGRKVLEDVILAAVAVSEAYRDHARTDETLEISTTPAKAFCTRSPDLAFRLQDAAVHPASGHLVLARKRRLEALEAALAALPDGIGPLAELLPKLTLVVPFHNREARPAVEVKGFTLRGLSFTPRPVRAHSSPAPDQQPVTLEEGLARLETLAAVLLPIACSEARRQASAPRPDWLPEVMDFEFSLSPRSRRVHPPYQMLHRQQPVLARHPLEAQALIAAWIPANYDPPPAADEFIIELGLAQKWNRRDMQSFARERTHADRATARARRSKSARGRTSSDCDPPS